MRNETKARYNWRKESVLLLGVGCLLLISLSWVPAKAQDPSVPPLDTQSTAKLEDSVELASSLIGIKTAEVAIAQAQEKIVKERKTLLSVEVETAQVAVTNAEKELHRLRSLKVSERDEKQLRATEASRDVAASLLKEAKAKVSIGEAEIVLETAKVNLAKAVLAEVTLRHKQLQKSANASQTN